MTRLYNIIVTCKRYEIMVIDENILLTCIPSKSRTVNLKAIL